MGGPRVNATMVRKIILGQKQAFTPDSIAELALCSRATVSKIMAEMVPHEIRVDHKQGKREFFAVNGVTVVRNETTGKDEVVRNASHIRSNSAIMELPPHERFQYVKNVTTLVARGFSPSAMVTGMSGIGKTYSVLEALTKLGWKQDTDFIVIKGMSTPMGLYRVLYEHQDQVILFDDCDEVFKVERAACILKAALDSYGVRRVSWRSERLPDDLENEFTFRGSIIFVSNLLACNIDEAVKSRTIVIDLQMSQMEICDYIEHIIRFDGIDWESLAQDTEEEYVSLDKKEMLKVINGLRDNIGQFDQFNFRTFLKACRIYKGTEICGFNCDWSQMMKVVI